MRPPCVNTSHWPGRHLFGVDGDDDALVADLGRGFGNEIGIVDRGRVHAHLVGTGVEQATHIGDGTHAAANGERDEDLCCAGFNYMQNDVALVGRCGDVEEGHLVGTLRVVAASDFNRIAGVAQIDEIRTFDDTTCRHVQAGDDAF